MTYDRLCLFEFGVASEVFGLPRPEIQPWYRFSLCAIEDGPFQGLGGLTLTARKNLRPLSQADLIVIPGWRNADEHPPSDFLRALQRAHARGARLVSLCSGVFVLAAAGLLHGKRATTHWRYAEQLQRLYPEIAVDPNVLYVDEGSLLTAAGSAAAIDLCLHIVRQDYGTKIANGVARRLVVPPHRDGGQAQYIARPVPEPDRAPLVTLLDWIRAHLQKPHSVASLAKQFNTSKRTLARRFEMSTGLTPMQWVTQQRVYHARELLETTDLTVESVARQCGLGSAQLLRFHFRRLIGTTPTMYRKAFRSRSAS